jgi:hypothetical protein
MLPVVSGHWQAVPMGGFLIIVKETAIFCFSLLLLRLSCLFTAIWPYRSMPRYIAITSYSSMATASGKRTGLVPLFE